MNVMQQQVLDFHRAMEMPDGTGPFHRADLRANLILEEALETVAALGYRVGFVDDDLGLVATGEPVDRLELIDGLCDLIYVALGCAVEMGVDLQPHFDEAHRANTAKAGGEIRADGKRLKPPGWTPPDHARVEAELKRG